MEDPLAEAVRNAIGVLRWQLNVMQSGWMTTSAEGHDTTGESISQTMELIRELEVALANRDQLGT